jgi:hypothetical protein
MSAVFYHAAYADGKFIRLCAHRHSTVSSAQECRSSAEEYVVAIENQVLRALTRAEEQRWNCGSGQEQSRQDHEQIGLIPA